MTLPHPRAAVSPAFRRPLLALCALAAAGFSPALYADNYAPDLMIIFGNTPSLNLQMGTNTLPPQTIASPVIPTINITMPQFVTAGDEPSSKLYIAKNALKTALGSVDLSTKPINLGFATFRQVFGGWVMGAYRSTNGIGFPTILNPALATVCDGPTVPNRAACRTNLAAPAQWAANFTITGTNWHGGANPAVANFFNDLPPPGVPKNETVYLCDLNYGANVDNYSSLWMTFPTATGPLIYVGPQYMAQFGRIGPGLEYQSAVGDPNNIYGASLKRVSDTAWGCYAPGGLGDSIQRWRGVSYIINVNYTTPFRGDSLAWFSNLEYSWNTNFTDTAGVGNAAESLTGWSGETLHSGIPDGLGPTDPVTGLLLLGSAPLLDTEIGDLDPTPTGFRSTGNANTTATYPSGPAKPDRAANAAGYGKRQLITNSWIQGGNLAQIPVSHMGPFLDLPDPILSGAAATTAMTNNRNIIKDVFLGLQQMNESGRDYNPTTQTIAGGRGLNVNLAVGNGFQSAVYDSLRDALAYYRAYLAKDPNSLCRSHNIMLFYDGREDSHLYYKNPAVVAAELRKINVKVHVVIISSFESDINAADAIATAGGTDSGATGHKAYVINNAGQLQAAFNQIIANVSGNISVAAATTPSRLVENQLVYLPGYEINPATGVAGHLRAYPLVKETLTNGNTGPDLVIRATEEWDAASTTKMDDSKRRQRLYSNSSSASSSDSPTLFSAIADDKFNCGACTPSGAEIKNYTFDPSHPNGTTLPNDYLGGRQPGSMLGIFSDTSMAPVLMDFPRNPYLLSDSTYFTYANDNFLRPPTLWFHNDDGFLYGINAQRYANDTFEGGELRCGWMPQPLHSGLKDYSTFWSGGKMRGGFTVTDGWDSGNSRYSTYVVGTVNSGAYHYSLRLDNTPATRGRINANAQRIWISSDAGETSPQNAAPVITYFNNGGRYEAYANYVTNSAAGVSTFHVDDVRRVSPSSDSSLSGNDRITSELVVSQTSRHSTANHSYDSGDKIFFGTQGGDVYWTPIKTLAGNLVFTKIGNFLNEPVLKLGVYTSDANKKYLWASSAKGITVFEWDPYDTSVPWKKRWWSWVGESGHVTYTINSTTGKMESGVEHPDNYDQPTQSASIDFTKVQRMPTDATVNGAPVKWRLTARPTLVNDVVILPISTAQSLCQDGLAKYYYYDIATGFATYNPQDGKTVLNNLYVGRGMAFAPSVGIIRRQVVILPSSAKEDVAGGGVTQVGGGSGSPTKLIKFGRVKGDLAWREGIN